MLRRNLNSLNKSYSKVLTYKQKGQLPISAGLGPIIGPDSGTHSSDRIFVHLVGWFSFFVCFFLFFLHTHLLVPAKTGYWYQNDLEPGKDGPALFLRLQFSTPGRWAEAADGQSSRYKHHCWYGTVSTEHRLGREDFLGHCTPRNMFELAPTQQGSPLEKFRAIQGTVREPKW